MTTIANVAETTDNSLLPTGLASNANQTFISTPESRPRQLCSRWMGSIRNDRFLTNWAATLTVCKWPVTAGWSQEMRAIVVNLGREVTMYHVAGRIQVRHYD